MNLPRDPLKAWTITKEPDGWYYWNDSGEANGPFESEDSAEHCLDSYSDGYYGTFGDE